MDVKAVIFRLGNEEFGVDITHVLSIERVMEITQIPNMPTYMVGVLDLRGNLIPVIDLKKLLYKKESEINDNTRVLIVMIDDKPLGLIVDNATDVMDIPNDTIQNLQGIEEKKSLLISGISNLKNRLIILLDINNLFKSDSTIKEIEKVRQTL